MSNRTTAPEAGPPMFLPAPFDGYPYLVTRIGRTPLRAMAVLPAGWPRARLLDLGVRQATANQLETCVCFGPADSVFISPDGELRPGKLVPVGIPAVERLALGESIPTTRDVVARREALRSYAKRHRGSGYLVGDGLEGGRPATLADIARLGGSTGDGTPKGLSRCTGCSELSGEYLWTDADRGTAARPVVRRNDAAAPGTASSVVPRVESLVLAVHCRCDNHNRCAACGEPLAARRLSAYHYEEADGRAWYLAAYAALGHRCARRAGATGAPRRRGRRRRGATVPSPG